MKKLKDKVMEIAGIAQECPENLQQICFELLLKDELSKQPASTSARTPKDERETAPQPKKMGQKGGVENGGAKQDDLALKDLHLKVRHLLQKHGLSVDHLNQLFFKEGDDISTLYDDLKTTRASESQIRIALLQSLRNAIQTGEFETAIESVREEATARKCYDSKNWGANFNNNSSLFDFDKYSKKLKTIVLTVPGKKQLADLISELQ